MELIDTCWDVNKEDTKEIFNRIIELIDTCWDVNADTVPVSCNHQSN